MNLTVLTLFMCFLSFAVTINPKNRGKFIFGKTETSDEDSKFTENGENEDVLEDEDFEDDDSDTLMNMMDSIDTNINSLTHLHVNQGEVLVPCFGMWWPVGGGSATYYDYGGGGDYYGDYRRKRRRSRKRNKAKMKKKRS